MSTKNFTVANFYVRRHFDNGVRIGVDRRLLLERSGLTESLLSQPMARIAPQRLADLIIAIWEQSDDEFLGLTNRSVRYGSFAFLAEQLVVRKTLGDVYNDVVRFYNLLSDGLHFSLKCDGDNAQFLIKHDPQLHAGMHLLIDFLLLIWHRFPSWLVGKAIPLRYALLAFPEPWHSAEYRFVFPCEVRFDQSCNSLVFDRQWLDAPVVQAPEQLIDYLARIPERWFHKQSFHQRMTTQVLLCLESRGFESDPGIESVSTELNITSRTLRRKLTTENTGFQTLKDSIRRDRAINLLADIRIPISDIGREVGFTEPAAFARAFKRWTGVPPGRYRQESGQ